MLTAECCFANLSLALFDRQGHSLQWAESLSGIYNS